MFDPSTENLIRRAPALEGLANESLAKEFTRIYATVVAVRMRLRDIASRDGSSEEATGPAIEEVREEMTFLAELAATQEALISVSPMREDRQSAAFVAGTAYYVLAQAQRLLQRENISRLEVEYVSPELSATLLFLIAGASADAAEMAKEIKVDDSNMNPVRATLALDIKRFARGELTKIVKIDDFVHQEGPHSSALAADALYFLTQNGMSGLAAQMLGSGTSEAYEKFQQVENLSTFTTPRQDGRNPIVNLFAGPRHLAVLLKILARDFPDASVANLPPPNKTDHTRWKKGVNYISRHRPFLWANHIEAVKSGYLDVGVSSAISFPTGAGKSTLSELKILSTLCTHQDVVFLAPTLSLVDQTARALDFAFPDAKVEREYASDDPFGFDSIRLPPITVMTPERCLALMGFEPKLFENVGLIVFDECHLLHAVDATRSKRAVDSMLCILNAIELNGDVDILMLSAMMSNAGDVAGWLEKILGRRCVPLSMNWKPTRQVRGCLVYPHSEVNKIQEIARNEHAKSKLKMAPKNVLAKMLTRPQGFFGLRQTWSTVVRSDYALLPLLEQPVQLALNKYWTITPNANHVSASIAAAAVGGIHGNTLKTLIFCQTTVNANSTAENARAQIGPLEIRLDSRESELFETALAELGDVTCLYVEVNPKNNVISSALPHHARLLPSERHLHESLYKRPDGINILAATSTLAQGMNLPSQIVIIAGDSRFDEAKNQLERLEAHELLNAAGRAGRAGESSYGFVLVIPSKVVFLNDDDGLVHKHWSGLREIFSQTDQCLAIEDPLAPVLDTIHLQGASSPEATYLLRRLPVGQAEEIAESKSRRLLGKTFNAYMRSKGGDDIWINTRIESALQAKKAMAQTEEHHDWADELAAKFGIEPRTLHSIESHLKAPAQDMTILGWIDWLFNWLEKNPEEFIAMVRPEGLEILFGKDYRGIVGAKERGDYALARLKPMVHAWMKGEPFSKMEMVFNPDIKKLNKCENSRDFALRIVPDLSYIASLPELVRRASPVVKESWLELERLSACVRDGFDTLEKLALYQIRRMNGSRVACHSAWGDIEYWMDPKPSEGEEWKELYERVKKTWEWWME